MVSKPVILNVCTIVPYKMTGLLPFGTVCVHLYPGWQTGFMTGFDWQTVLRGPALVSPTFPLASIRPSL